MSRYKKNLIDELRCIAHKDTKDINREDFKTVAEGLAEVLDLFSKYEDHTAAILALRCQMTLLQRAMAKSVEREIALVKSA